MKSLSRILCLVTIAFLAREANAQCPAGVTPLNFLAGKTWAFETHDLEIYASVGIFNTSVGTARGSATPAGLLNITQTSNFANGILNQANFAGGYTVDPDCSGGTLTFNQGGNGFIFRFLLVKGSSEMLFIDQDSAAGNPGQAPFQHGRAQLLAAAPACPAGTNPLNILNGTTWGFLTANVNGYVGTFSASLAGAGPTGVLKVTESSTPSVLRQDQVTGIFGINPDCSGGYLNLGTSGEAGIGGGMYAFVFTSPTSMYLVADSNTEPNNFGNPFPNFGQAYLK